MTFTPTPPDSRLADDSVMTTGTTPQNGINRRPSRPNLGGVGADLFDKRTRKQRVIDWALQQKYIKTSTVYSSAPKNGWGNRAVRNLQDYAEHHPDKIRRLSNKEIKDHFGIVFYEANTEGIWMVVK